MARITSIKRALPDAETQGTIDFVIVQEKGK